MDMMKATRSLLLKSGRIPAQEFLERWVDEYGYAFSFPFFGFEDWYALLQQLQPGALAVVSKQGTVIAASSDTAFAKECTSPTKWPELHSSGTASEWLISCLEKELKAVRQSVTERRRAQKDAEAQADKIRQEYQRIQSQKTAHTRGLKADLVKRDQKTDKFRQEAEEFEAKEKKLLASLSAERKETEIAASAGAVVPSVAARSQ